ncbi:MAG: hypothetical protein KatS3mg087_1854 [Patescibacteria group bacterium]|nr:MAG: hypothetical protein KatS3mg087_1854 [Patescibacteria group bacterium]
MYLTIRTDKPESELGLYDGHERIAYVSWEAHRQLAETIHTKINELLRDNRKNLSDIKGVVCYKGPGSFTGLRIGLTVGNALAYSLDIPIAGTNGDDWQVKGIYQLTKNPYKQTIVPDYGREAHITKQKK